jgi:protein phosphatase-4 regulatory subunit 3
VDITQDFVEESEDERFEDMSDTAPPVELPPCELNKLEAINEVSYFLQHEKIGIS